MTVANAGVRIASIGAGMIGTVHARIAAELPECEFAALCDIDPSTEALARKLGARYYRDYRLMLEAEELDGVVISLPNAQHLPVGRACAERGLHIMMEKPIAPSVSEAEDLIRCTRKNGVRMIVGHHRRFNPMVVATRDLIRRGDLGEIAGISVLWSMYKPDEYFSAGDWRKTKGAGGPILINSIHEIDNLRYIYGEIESVQASTGNRCRRFEVEDTVSFIVRFVDGVLASVLMTDAAPSLWAYESSMGENPFFYPTDGDIYHFLGRKASLTFPGMVKVFYPDSSRAGWQYPLAREQLDIRSADPYPDQMSHFCRVIRGVEEPRTSGEDALATLKVVVAMQESASSGRRVVIDESADL